MLFPFSLTLYVNTILFLIPSLHPIFCILLQHHISNLQGIYGMFLQVFMF